MNTDLGPYCLQYRTYADERSRLQQYYVTDQKMVNINTISQLAGYPELLFIEIQETKHYQKFLFELCLL